MFLSHTLNQQSPRPSHFEGEGCFFFVGPPQYSVTSFLLVPIIPNPFVCCESTRCDALAAVDGVDVEICDLAPQVGQVGAHAWSGQKAVRIVAMPTTSITGRITRFIVMAWSFHSQCLKQLDENYSPKILAGMDGRIIRSGKH
jgi:hypothetical protein